MPLTASTGSVTLTTTQSLTLIGKAFVQNEIPEGFIGRQIGNTNGTTTTLDVGTFMALPSNECSVNELDIVVNNSTRELNPRKFDGQVPFCVKTLCAKYTPASKLSEFDFIRRNIENSAERGIFLQAWFSKKNHTNTPLGNIDGYFEKIKQEVALNNITPLNLNSGTPLSAGDAYTTLSNMLAALPKKYKSKKQGSMPAFLVTPSVYENLKATASLPAITKPANISFDCTVGEYGELLLDCIKVIEVSEWEQGFTDPNIYAGAGANNHYAILTIPGNLQWKGLPVTFSLRTGTNDTPAQGKLVWYQEFWMDVQIAQTDAIIVAY